MATPESVIEIGSTGVRLLVAEVTSDRKQNVLDRSDMPLQLPYTQNPAFSAPDL